jgi:hypothetical protein
MKRAYVMQGYGGSRCSVALQYKKVRVGLSDGSDRPL